MNYVRLKWWIIKPLKAVAPYQTGKVGLCVLMVNYVNACLESLAKSKKRQLGEF